MDIESLRPDDIDRQIVACLVEDARRSFTDIGAVVGLSAPAVKRRVDRLVEAGVIQGFSAIVDPAASGRVVEVFVELFCGHGTRPQDILDSVAAHPEVVAAYTVTGDADALVHLRAESMHAVEPILERIRLDAGADRSRSVVVLSRLLERRPSL